MGPLIPLALGVAQYAGPKLAQWIFGDEGEAVAEQVVGVAKSVTGLGEPDDAVAAIRKDPALQIEFQKAIQPLLIARLEAETRRLEAVNATMAKEYASGDPYVRRWRPTVGYLIGAAWFIQFVAVSLATVWVVIAAPVEAGTVIGAIGSAQAATLGLWTVALAVVGVNVAKRSEDKRVAAGQAPDAGILGAVAKRIGGGKEAGLPWETKAQ